MRVKTTLMDHADQLMLHQLRGIFCEGEDHADGPCRSVNVTSTERLTSVRVKITLMDNADQLLLHQLRGIFCEGEDHTDGPCRSVNVTSTERLLL